MARIFGNSKGNLIYLGDGNRTTKTALDNLDAVWVEIRSETNSILRQEHHVTKMVCLPPVQGLPYVAKLTLTL